MNSAIMTAPATLDPWFLSAEALLLTVFCYRLRGILYEYKMYAYLYFFVHL